MLRLETAGRLARKYAEMNMIASVRIARMAAPTEFEPDDVTNHATVLRVVYEGKARLYGLSGGGEIDYGDELQAFSSSYVSVPLDAEVQVDDLVEVLEHPDEQAVGRVFRVLDVDGGGQFPAARRLQVTGVQKFREWTFVDEP